MTLLRSGSASDIGLVRSSNQDLVVETATLFAVADGMGGHAGGEVAARLAATSLTTAFNRHPTGAGLTEAVAEANQAVWEHSLEDPDLRGMGTTLTAIALVNEDGRDLLALVNVGDSRAYRFHDGGLVQLTTDHSLAEEMVRTGELSAAEAAVHPHRHILTRALGVSAEVMSDLWWIRPERGDRFLLCSDGLTNELDDAQVAEVLSSVADPARAAELLVQAARTHGGSDNITVVVVDVLVGEDEPEEGGAAAVAAGDAPLPAIAPSAGDRGDGEDASDSAVTPEVQSSRRERRRAKRRQRRMARGRRLVTVRTVLFAAVVAAVLAAGFYAVRWYDTNSFFVTVDHNELVIYQGRIGGFLWYHPVTVERTGVTTSDVPATYLSSLRSGVEETSVAGARSYVSNLVTVEQQQNSAQGAPSTTAPPTTTTTTTTKAGG
ncbi:MAG: Stp1/IreP family PP2C-type Ser/Thr phosphatase [Acidimicrobiales bacterium]